MPYRLRITDSEVRTELSKLGYNNVSQEQVEEFRKDLLRLIKRDLKKLKEQKKAEDTESTEDPSHYFDHPPPLRTSSRHDTKGLHGTREHGRERHREVRSPHISGRDLPHYEKSKDRRPKTGGYVSYSSSEIEESGYSEVSDSDDSRRTPSQLSCISHGSLESHGETDSLNGVQDINKDIISQGARPREISATKTIHPSKTITQGKAKRQQTNQGSKKGLIPSYPHKPDPVNLYHYYKQIWNKFPVPGEDPHAALRWETRTKLFYST